MQQRVDVGLRLPGASTQPISEIISELTHDIGAHQVFRWLADEREWHTECREECGLHARSGRMYCSTM